MDLRRVWLGAAILGGTACGGPAAPPVVELSPPGAPAAQGAAVPDAARLAEDARGLAVFVATARDARRTWQQPRPRGELIAYIQGLESAFAATPRNDPGRPDRMWQLAEGYVELEAAATHGAQAKEEPAKAAKIAVAARQGAIRYYMNLHLQYPQACRGAGSCDDEVLYHLALEQERAQALDEARKHYLELVQGFPRSCFATLGYLAFGELFVQEARKDPMKWPLAEQAFEEVVRQASRDEAAWGLSRLRLGEVREGRRQTERAADELRRAAEFAEQHPSLSGAAALAAEARRRRAALSP
jgi:TolA-binding protein